MGPFYSLELLRRVHPGEAAGIVPLARVAGQINRHHRVAGGRPGPDPIARPCVVLLWLPGPRHRPQAGRRGEQHHRHRLLRSLQARGYVRHDEARKYSLGAAAFRLGDAALRSLAHSARPFLTRLVERTGETANLSVLEGDDVVYVAQVPSPHTLRMFAEVGRHVPPHSTASGKVLLASLPTDEAAALVRRAGLRRMTVHTITDARVFREELDAVRARGWASDEGEQEQGVRCVAVPVGRGADVFAAISLSGPAERFPGAAQDGLVEHMQRVASEFAAASLGEDGDGG
jgi:IclR family acetate operon transcriptional repressor